MPGAIPGSGRYPGGGTGSPRQYCCLVHRAAKSWTQPKQLSTHTHTQRTLGCGIWGLVLWPGIEPQALRWEHGPLDHQGRLNVHFYNLVIFSLPPYNPICLSQVVSISTTPTHVLTTTPSPSSFLSTEPRGTLGTSQGLKSRFGASTAMQCSQPCLQ